MKPIILKIISFLVNYLSDEAVQESMIGVAEKLAKKTTSKWDDKRVAEFKQFWKWWNITK